MSSRSSESQHAGGPRRPRSSASRIVAIVVIVVSALAIAGAGVAALLLMGPKDPYSGIEIADNVVVYDEEESSFDILACDADTVTVSSADGIEVGTVLNAGVTDETPNGLLRTVTAIEEADGGYALETRPAALTEAIERCDFSATVSYNEDGTYEVAWRNNANGELLNLVETAGADELDNLFSGSLAIDGSDNFVLVDGNDEAPKGSVEIGDVSLGDLFEVDLKIEDGEVDISVVNHFYAGLDMERFDASFNETIFKTKLPTLVIPAGPVLLVFSNDLSVDLNASASFNALGMDLSASVDKSFGFGYKTGEGVRGISEDDSHAPTIEFSPEEGGEVARVDLGAGLGVAISCRLYGLAGPELNTGIEADAEATLQALRDGEKGDGAVELPGTDVRFKGHAKGTVSIPISGYFKMGLPFNPFDGSEDTFDLVDAELFDTDDLISWTIFDASFGTIAHTYTSPALEGPTSGSDGMPLPGAEIGTVPALAFDYPENWEVRNARENTDSESTDPETSPWASCDLVNTETGTTLRYFIKVGANGGASGPDVSRTVLGNTGLDDIEVVERSSGGATWSHQSLCLRNKSNPYEEYVSVGDGSVQLQTTGGDIPARDSEEYQQIVDILCSLRLAE